MADGFILEFQETVNNVVTSTTSYGLTFADVITESAAATGDTNYIETPPETETSAGTKGQYSFDDDWGFFCVAANHWKKFPLVKI